MRGEKYARGGDVNIADSNGGGGGGGSIKRKKKRKKKIPGASKSRGIENFGSRPRKVACKTALPIAAQFPGTERGHFRRDFFIFERRDQWPIRGEELAREPLIIIVVKTHGNITEPG